VFRIFGERELSLTAKHGPEGGASTLSPGRYPTFDSFGISDEQCPVELPVEEWVHLAFSLTHEDEYTRTIRFYVNGKLSYQRLRDLRAAPDPNYDWPAESWYFGRGEAPTVHGNHYEGLLSDLAVFGIALTEEQIRQVMNGDFRLPAQ
jgi:hypothetical protein